MTDALNVDWLAELRPRQRRMFEDDGPVVMLSVAERDLLVAEVRAQSEALADTRTALRQLLALVQNNAHYLIPRAEFQEARALVAVAPADAVQALDDAIARAKARADAPTQDAK